jgi:plastocyanin
MYTERCALVIVMVTALAAGPLAGCDDGGAVGDRAGSVEEQRCDEREPVVTVTLAAPGVSPAEVIIGAGDVVRWHNDDAHAHTVTSGTPERAFPGAMFGTGPIEPGDEACLRFHHAGAYDFFCELHPETAGGRVTVQ